MLPDRPPVDPPHLRGVALFGGGASLAGGGVLASGVTGPRGSREARGKMNIRNVQAAAATATESGRMNTGETLAQIGMMNVAAISGGRVVAAPNAVIMPVSSGYHVVVSLAGNDTYTVRRVFVRGGKASVKGEWTDIYCDEVGEVAYGASCYR